jgi:hypothetical protein
MIEDDLKMPPELRRGLASILLDGAPRGPSVQLLEFAAFPNVIEKALCHEPLDIPASAADAHLELAVVEEPSRSRQKVWPVTTDGVNFSRVEFTRTAFRARLPCHDKHADITMAATRALDSQRVNVYQNRRTAGLCLTRNSGPRAAFEIRGLDVPLETAKRYQLTVPLREAPRITAQCRTWNFSPVGKDE